MKLSPFRFALFLIFSIILLDSALFNTFSNTIFISIACHAWVWEGRIQAETEEIQLLCIL